MKKILLALSITFVLFACGGSSQESSDASESKEAPVSMLESEEDNGVFFIAPADRDTVQNPVKLKFGIKGMEVEPAGAINEGKGHHHVTIDGSFAKKGVVVPADSVNIHYGKGQTETELILTPGPHTLTMQFADGFHQSYGEKWSSTITVYVEDSATEE